MINSEFIRSLDALTRKLRPEIKEEMSFSRREGEYQVGSEGYKVQFKKVSIIIDQHISQTAFDLLVENFTEFLKRHSRLTIGSARYYVHGLTQNELSEPKIVFRDTLIQTLRETYAHTEITSNIVDLTIRASRIRFIGLFIIFTDGSIETDRYNELRATSHDTLKHTIWLICSNKNRIQDFIGGLGRYKQQRVALEELL